MPGMRDVEHHRIGFQDEDGSECRLAVQHRGDDLEFVDELMADTIEDGLMVVGEQDARVDPFDAVLYVFVTFQGHSAF